MRFGNALMALTDRRVFIVLPKSSASGVVCLDRALVPHPSRAGGQVRYLNEFDRSFQARFIRYRHRKNALVCLACMVFTNLNPAVQNGFRSKSTSHRPHNRGVRSVWRSGSTGRCEDFRGLRISRLSSNHFNNLSKQSMCLWCNTSKR